MEQPGSPSREKEKRHGLHCRTCAAGNPLSRTAREQGWFDCIFCGSASPIAGAGTFAVKGPKGLVTHLIRPAASTFVVSRGGLLGYEVWILLLLGADVGLGVIQLAVHSGAPKWIASLLWSLVVVLAIGGFLLCRTEQVAQVVRGTVTLSYRLAGVTWRKRAVSTKQFRAAQLAKPKSAQLRALNGALRVRFEEAASANWFVSEVTKAVSGSHRSSDDDNIECPACGGPLPTERNIRDDGGVDCLHCGTGLLHVEGGVILPAAILSCDLPGRALPTYRPETAHGRTTWRLPPWRVRQPVKANLSFAVLTTVIALVLWGALHLTFSTAVFRLALGTLALGVATGCAWAVWFMVGAWGGVTELTVDTTAVSHLQRIGPFTWRRGTIALARLLSAAATLSPQKNAFMVEWQTANQVSVQVCLEMTPAIHGVLHEFVDTIRSRLATAERELEWKPCQRPPAPASPKSRE